MNTNATANSSVDGGDTDAPRQTLSNRQFWVTAIALALMAAIAEIQQLMVIPMLGLISSELKISASAVSWVLLSTLLVSAVTIGPLSKMADKYGPKPVYFWSMIAILLGNALCAIAIMQTSPTLMILGRGLIGINVATPLGVAVLRKSCDAKQMKQGMGIVTLGLGIGVAPSFLLSGALLDAGVSLANVFWVATALAATVVLLTLLLAKSDQVPGITVPLRSAFILGAWVLPALLAISKGNDWGWYSPLTIGLLVFAAIVLTYWIRNENRSERPLIAPHLLRGDAVIGYFCASCIGLMAYGYYITASTFVQVPPEAGYGFGASIIEAGLVLVPSAVVIIVLGPVAGKLLHLWGPRTVLLLGASILTAQFFAMIFVKSELWQMYVYAGWFGVGVALFMPAGWAVFAKQAKPEEIGIAGGMMQIFGQLMGALASAAGVIFLTRETIPGTPLSVESGFSGMFAFLAIVLALALTAAFFLKNSGRDNPMAAQSSL